MSKEIQVEEIKIKFNYLNNVFEAKITPSDIIVEGVGRYNRQSGYFEEESEQMDGLDDNCRELKEILKEMRSRHRCGAQGFGLSISDTCPACERQYQSQVMRDLNNKCNELEKILKEF